MSVALGEHFVDPAFQDESAAVHDGHAVAALGYGHPGWTKAVTEQARDVNFQSNAVPMDVRLRAAQRLVKFSQLPIESVFFVNSGAEANENALKMAFTMNPGRTGVVALEMSFHGRTAAAAALTWGAKEKWYGFPRTPFDVSFIPRRDIAALSKITDKTAAVHFLRFELDDASRAALKAGASLKLGVDHARYRHEVEASAAVRASLAADLD